jgi:gluconate 5-dehydrogenase
MMDMFDLKGKVAVVIGGAGGIGESLVKGLSQYGAKVVVASRNQEAIEKVAAAVEEETGNDTFSHTVDVTSEDSMNKLKDAVVEKFGTCDILVNAMGLNLKRLVIEFPVDEWDTMFDINVKGTMIACKVFGNVMKENRSGKIINLSSVREIRSMPGGDAGYAATKAAVGMYTKTLALEMAEYNVNVNAIGPALIITPGTIHVIEDPVIAKKMKEMIPLGRLGYPEDLVGACIFLSSKASDFVSGQTYFLDGGLTVK